MGTGGPRHPVNRHYPANRWRTEALCKKCKDSLAENGVGDVSLTLRCITVAVTYDSQQTVVLRDGGAAPSRDE